MDGEECNEGDDGAVRRLPQGIASAPVNNGVEGEWDGRLWGGG